jgi:hypothetical protein
VRIDQDGRIDGVDAGNMPETASDLAPMVNAQSALKRSSHAQSSGTAERRIRRKRLSNPIASRAPLRRSRNGVLMHFDLVRQTFFQ